MRRVLLVLAALLAVGALSACGASKPAPKRYGSGCGPILLHRYGCAPTGAPTNSGTPSITGTPDISTFVAPQLMGSTGSWTGSPTSYTLQWQDCNSSGTGCINGQGVAYGPGADAAACTVSSTAAVCGYNLTAAEYSACPAASGSGVCLVKLAVTATNGGGSATSTVSAGTVTDADSGNPWPNYSNTGYQNTPANFNGYGNQSYAAATGGTEGVANQSLLAAAGTSGCPTTISSNTTIAFCDYTSQLTVGTSASPVTNVHFIGDAFQSLSPCCTQQNVGGTNYWTYSDNTPLALNCSSGCTLDYDTFKPSDLSVPDFATASPTTPSTAGHGTTYAMGYADACDCGFESTVVHGTTFDHDDVWGGGGEFILDGNNTVSTPNVFEDNWMHDQADCAADQVGIGTPTSGYCTQHDDGIGMVNTGSSTSYVTINHNNMPFIRSNTNNIAFQSGTYSNLTITNNVFSGDGYTVAVWATSTNTAFTGNVWTNYAQQQYEINYGQSFWTQSGSTWSTNTFAWDPTGASPFYQEGPGIGNVEAVTSAANGMCWVPPSTGTSDNLSTTDYGGGAC